MIDYSIGADVDDDEVSGIWDALAQGINTGGDYLVAREQRRAITGGGDANAILAMRRGNSPLRGSASTFAGNFGGGMLPLILGGALILFVLKR